MKMHYAHESTHILTQILYISTLNLEEFSKLQFRGGRDIWVIQHCPVELFVMIKIFCICAVQ